MNKHGKHWLLISLAVAVIVTTVAFQYQDSPRVVTAAVAKLRDAGVAVSELNYVPTSKALTGNRWHSPSKIPWEKSTYSVTVPPGLATTVTFETIAILAREGALLNVAYASPSVTASRMVSLDELFGDVALSIKSRQAFRNSATAMTIQAFPQTKIPATSRKEP